MGLIRFVIWTSLCVAFGIFLATWEVGGRTPWKLMQTAWQTQRPAIEKVKHEAGEAVEGVKAKVEKSGPKETHSADDRRAIDALIAGKSKT